MDATSTLTVADLVWSEERLYTKNPSLGDVARRAEKWYNRLVRLEHYRKWTFHEFLLSTRSANDVNAVKSLDFDRGDVVTIVDEDNAYAVVGEKSREYMSDTLVVERMDGTRRSVYTSLIRHAQIPDTLLKLARAQVRAGIAEDDA